MRSLPKIAYDEVRRGGGAKGAMSWGYDALGEEKARHREARRLYPQRRVHQTAEAHPSSEKGNEGWRRNVNKASRD
jgi:hypothetical protein